MDSTQYCITVDRVNVRVCACVHVHIANMHKAKMDNNGLINKT